MFKSFSFTRRWIVVQVSIVLLAGMGFMFSSTNAWASCGAGNCFLVTGTQEGISSPGQMTLDISYRYIPM
ncbi:MAG: hypothetical protein ACE5F7_09465, partial [Nitrospiria bacterium]